MIRLLLVVAFAAVAHGLAPRQAGQEFIYEYETQLATGVPTESKMYSGLKLKTTVRFQTQTATHMIMKFENPTMYMLNDMVESADPTNQQLPDDLFKPLMGEEARMFHEELTKPVKFTYVNGRFSNIQTESDDPFWSVNIKRGLLGTCVMNFDERQSLDAVSRLIHMNRLPQNQAEVYTVMEPSVAGECETVYKVHPYTETHGETYLYVTKTRNYMKCLSRASYTHTMYNGYACAECEKDRTEPIKSGSQIRYVLKGNKRTFVFMSFIAESQHVFTPYAEKGGNVATYINQTFIHLKTTDIQQRIPDLRNPKSSGIMAELPKAEKQSPWNPASVAQSSQEQQSSQEEQQSSQEQQQQSPRRQFLTRRQQRQQSQQQRQQERQQQSQQRQQQRPREQQRRQQEESQRHQLTPAQRDMIKQKIDKLLQTVATYTEQTVQEEVAPMVLALLEEMQHADNHVMHDMYQKYGTETHPTNRKIKHIRKTFWDILPNVGNYDAMETLSEAMMANKMTPGEAANAFIAFTFAAKPDIRTAQKLMELAENAFVKSNRYVHQSLWLCLGAVGDRINQGHLELKSSLQKKLHLLDAMLQQENRSPVAQELRSKMRQMQDIMEKSATLASQIKREIVQKVQEMLRSTRMEDKILGLKTMGNAGFHELLPDVASILEDKSHPWILRSQAVWNLRKMAHTSPKAVRAILLPRYFDTHEDEEVRIAAYFMVSMSKPPRPVLQAVAQSLRRERNPHVGTFVYTHLEQVAASTHPCLMTLAKKATFVLRFAKRFTPRYHYSRFRHFNIYNDKLKMGTTLEYGVISSPREFTPRACAVNWKYDAFGYSMDTMEVGYSAEGIQKLFSKLFGPDGILSTGKSILDILKQRRPRSSGDQQQQPSIQQQLGVTPRESPDVSGHVYLKMFGNEFRYFDLNHDFIAELLQSGKLSLSRTEEELQAGTPLNMYRTIVFGNTENVMTTEAGMPIHLKFHTTGVFKVDGSMTVSGVPSLFLANRPGQNAAEITARINLTPSTVFNMRGTMEIDGRFFKSGAAVNALLHAEAPLGLTLTGEPIHGKVTAKLDVSRLREKVLKMEVTPQTFVHFEPCDIRKWPTQPDTKDIEVMEGAKLSTYSKQYGTNSLGLTFSFKGQSVTRNFYPKVPYCPLIGKQHMHLTVTPGTNPPTLLELQLKYLQNSQSWQQSSGERSSREHSNSSEQEQNSSESQWQLIPSFISRYFGSKQERRSEQQHPQQQQNRQQQSMQQSSEEQLPQRSIETSMTSLKQKVQEISTIYPEGPKNGIVLLLSAMTPNTPPSRQAKIYALCQVMPDGQRTRFTFRYTRMPIPQEEEPLNKIDIDMSFKFPRTFVSPSQLLDPSYQQEIQRQIQFLVQSDGSHQVMLSLDDKVPSQQAIQAQKVQSSSNIKDTLESLVDIIIEKAQKSSDQEMKELAKVVQDQKQSSRKAKSLRQQSYESKKSQKKLAKLKELISKSQDIQSKISQKLRSVSERNDDPRKAVLVKYAILKQQEMQQQLMSVFKALKSSAQPSTQQDISQALSQQKAKLKDLQSKQSSQLSSRSDAELQRKLQHSRESSEVSCLQAIKQLLDSQDQVIAELSSPSSSSSIQQSTLQSVIESSKSAQEQCKQALSDPTSDISKIQSKLMEVLIQSQQIAKSLKQRMHTSRWSPQPSSQRSQQQSPQQLQQSVRQMEQIKVQAVQLSKLLAQLESEKKEKQDVLQSIPSSEQSIYKKLQKVEVLQTVATNQLKDPASDDQAKKQRLQKSLQTAESAQQKLSRIILTKSSELRSPQSKTKVSQVAEKQKHLMNIISKSARKISVEFVSQKQHKDQELERAKARSEELLLQHLSVLSKLQKALKKQDRYVTSNQQQSQPSSDERSRQSSIQQQSRSSNRSRQQRRQQSLQQRQQSSREQSLQESTPRQQSSQRTPAPFEMMMTVKYGSGNDSMSEMHIQLVGRKSMQQLLSEQQQTSPLYMSKLTKQYLADKEQGDESVKKSYQKLKQELNILRHFHMDIHFTKSHIPESTRLYFWNVQEMMKAIWYPHMSLQYPGPHSHDGSIQMIFNIKNNNEQMDIDLITPYETNRFRSLFIPTACQNYYLYSQQLMQSIAYHSRKLSSLCPYIPQQQAGICQMKGKTIQTLDQKEYKSPNTDGCDSVLVMDCSSASKFAVKVQPRPSDPQKKIVKIVTESKSVEIDPSGQAASVKIDGQRQSLQDGQSMKVPSSQTSPQQSSSTAVKVSKKGRIITASMPKQGVEVKSDGEMVSVKVSQYHYSRVCGLCGNFDGKHDNDYEGPQKEQHSSSKSFVYKYLQPNQQCSMSLISRLRANSEQSVPTSPAVCQPLQRTVIRHDPRGKTCFSTQPMKQCKPGCRATSSQSKSIPMHCMMTSPQTREYQRQSSQRPLTEMQGKRVDKTEHVLEPVSCSRA